MKERQTDRQKERERKRESGKKGMKERERFIRKRTEQIKRYISSMGIQVYTHRREYEKKYV